MLNSKSTHMEVERQAANTRLYMNRLCMAWQGRTWEEAHMDYTFEDYREALDGAGPRLKELVLDRAAHDPKIDFPALKALVDFAYPEET